MNKIFVIGYFGYNSNQLDGQTVKTRSIYKLACNQFGNSIQYYDTEDFKYNKLSIFRMFWQLIQSKTLIYLPAHNNLKYIFPLIFILSVLFSVNIHYFVVGGWLREFIRDKPIHRFMLKHIEAIHAETDSLKQELNNYYNITNVDIFPNFRFFNFNTTPKKNNKLKLVFMARINKMKGLDWIFELAESIKINNLQDKISITFFGPINIEDKEYFEEHLNHYSFISYNGSLEPNEIYETLSLYDVMLLPTHYYTEGLPGSIVDAYISGIPVIVTKWKHATEFVEDGKSGYIIPFENGQEELIEKVLELEINKTQLYEMKDYVLVKRNEFAPPNMNDYLKIS